MQIKIENKMLTQVINFLYDLKLKAKPSRHRTKFIKMLSNRLQEFAEQEQELLKEHCHLDAEGNPLKTTDGKGYQLKNVEGFKNDRIELFDEYMVIEGADNERMLKVVKRVLEECDKELSGEDAAAYDYLLDQFEKEDEQE